MPQIGPVSDALRCPSPVEYPNVSKLSEPWTHWCPKTSSPRATLVQLHPLPSSPLSEDSFSAPKIGDKVLKSGGVFKKWRLEAISWAISAGCMSAIIGILLYLKNEKLDKWKALNACFSVLTRITSGSLLLPVSEALGQLKWNWFFNGTSKKMWDFEIYENASRGPWGSLQLLIRTKGSKLAALGAAIVLFALALDPFFQQVLDFPNHWTILNRNCSIPRVSRYEPSLDEVFVGGVKAVTQDKNLQAVAEKFFYDNGTQPVPFANGTRADFPIYCPTSTCTWPVYETLGVCSTCVDVSRLLTFTCMPAHMDWISRTNGTGPSGKDVTYPTSMVCGYFLNATSENPVFMSGYAVSSDLNFTREALLMRALPLVTNPLREPLYGSGSINFKHHRNPIADVVIVRAADGADSVYNNKTPIALECVLSWCVKTMRSSYSLGRYTEDVSSIFINTTTGPFPWTSRPVVSSDMNTTFIKYLEDVTLDVSNYTLDIGTAPRNASGYGVSRNTAFNSYNIFTDMFPSFITAANASADPLMRYSIVAKGLPRTRILTRNPWISPNNISAHMERFAKALTDAIRSSDSRESIRGLTLIEETYIAVQWGWLSLPLGLLLFSLIFLFLTIFKTYKDNNHMGIWKTSSIPTILHGLPDDMQKQIVSTTISNTLKTQGRKLKARFL